MKGSRAESPIGATEFTFKTGVPTAVFTFTLGVVDVVPKAVSRGRNKRAVGAIVGTTAVGVTTGTTAVGVTIGATAVGAVTGSTVTWMTDRAGLKNMVTVAAACLVSRGILIGARRERAVRGWSPGNRNGPCGARNGRGEKGNPEPMKKGVLSRKGFGSPKGKGNWATAFPPAEKINNMINKSKRYRLIIIIS